jgi:hypothetical protein
VAYFHRGASCSVRLAWLIYAVHQMTLERFFARVRHHLGRKRAHFLGLSRQCVELLAPMGRLQLHDIGKLLGARQALGQVEYEIYIPLGDVDDFAVERGCAPPRCWSAWCQEQKSVRRQSSDNRAKEFTDTGG